MSAPIEDGGPIASTLKNDEVTVTPQGGLSIRDYFAGQALAGMGCQWQYIKDYITRYGGEGHATDVRSFMAYAAYAQADAMIAAREGRAE